MTALSEFVRLLRCPQCGSPAPGFDAVDSPLTCSACFSRFPVVAGGRPVLLRHDNALFPHSAYLQPFTGASTLRSRLRRLVPSPSVNLSFDRSMARIKAELASFRPAEEIVVLVVGGGLQRSALDAALGAGGRVRTVYSDIDVHADADLFCDGHDLPFQDGSIDVVITTAVLEHVLHPEQAVAEMRRVLRVGGLVYSEVPFMIQVHEGAYDFTRYTHSGHRRLFNGFREIDSGMVAGPATALVWTIEYFVLSFLSRQSFRLAAKVLVRTLFFWIKYLDLLLKNKPEAYDAAACTYFLGARIEGRIDDAAIISGYIGGQRVRHV